MAYSRELDVYDLDEPVVEPPPPDSDRSRSVALVLGVIGGLFGMHRFYAGRARSAVWMILTLGGAGLWWLYDLILLASGEFRDAQGRRIRQWDPQSGDDTSPTRQGLEDVSQQLHRLERDVAELAERLDFAERLLAQQRDRDRLTSS
jgi:hypothetical protein